MAHYSELDKNNIVLRVIVISEEDEGGSEETGVAFCRALFNLPESKWKKTSYNTYSGKHILGGTPFRLNYGSVGMIYNEEFDGFVTERDIPDEWVSWKLSATTGRYEPPVAIPIDSVLGEDVEPTPENIKKLKSYYWDEDSLSWLEAGTVGDSLDPIPVSL